MNYFEEYKIIKLSGSLTENPQILSVQGVRRKTTPTDRLKELMVLFVLNSS
jgi:hypothetical protein